jgi:hypothetical protein
MAYFIILSQNLLVNNEENSRVTGFLAHTSANCEIFILNAVKINHSGFLITK